MVAREGDGTPLQYSCLENPMDGGAWWAAVHGVAKSWTLLSYFTFTVHFHALEKAVATHSSVLAWRIPGTGEPGGLPSMGSHRVRHDWSDLAAAIQSLMDSICLSSNNAIQLNIKSCKCSLKLYVPCWISLVTKRVQIKTTATHPTPTKMAKMLKGKQ